MTAENIEKRKQTRNAWITLATNLVSFACVLVLALRGSGPLNGTSLEGTVVILNEKGQPIPWRNVDLTFYSHYPSGFFRSERDRKRNLYVGKSEFGHDVPIGIPSYAATLFFHTTDKKYAAVVDLGPKDPTTGLVVELRPRYSATGRLVNQAGTPLAHYEFSLDFSRVHELRFRKVRGTWVETFEYEYCITDSEGYFKVDHLIPGLEYSLRVHLPDTSRYTESIKMPILKPEQYEQPYSLGDVAIRD